MQPLWLCMLWSKCSKTSFENSYRPKAIQMQPMWLRIYPCKQFEETFENSFWVEVVQMQPMRLCICLWKQFEETFENSLWGEVKQVQPMWLCMLGSKLFKKTYKTHIGTRQNATNVTLPPSGQAVWGLTYWKSVVHKTKSYVICLSLSESQTRHNLSLMLVIMKIEKRFFIGLCLISYTIMTCENWRINCNYCTWR